MNPEEGDLRPQLSDRFAHGIVIQDDFTAEQRVEVVRRRIQFDDDPDGFVKMHTESLADLSKRVARARTLVKSVTVCEEQRLEIANRARELRVEGLRAELAVLRTARCAAWQNRWKIEQPDLDEAWRMCLGHRRPENRAPISPPSPPSSSQRFNPPLAHRTSVAPVNSLPDPKRLPDPKLSPHQLLRDWAKNVSLEMRGPGPRVTSGAAEPVPHGSIDWIATVLSSVPISTSSDGKIRLRYHSIHRRPSVWCFLDASRSTGMSRCLSAARDSLMDLATHFRSPRWNLLLLRDNQIEWIFKQSSGRSFSGVLTQLENASGKSYLFQSIHLLQRAILKRGPASQDRVVIVSDGLASVEAGRRQGETASRLRHCLRRLTQMNVPTAWLYPSKEPALVRWLQKVLHGMPVTSIKL
jgi:hypothetical protein